MNNAAFQATHEKIEDLTAEELDRTFRTNIYSMFYLAKAAAAHMKPGASIINTSSINSKSPNAELLPYATTKGAIANFTSGAAQLLADRGIRVNSVAPGPVWTPLIRSTMDAKKAAHFGENTPLGRPAQPAAARCCKDAGGSRPEPGARASLRAVDMCASLSGAPGGLPLLR